MPGTEAQGVGNSRPYIGGQAVLEGVMMRSPTSFAVVVRRRDGSLHARERAVPDGRKGVWRLPFARGVASLVESLKLGSEALKFSAEQLERDYEDDEPPPEKKKSGGAAASVLRAIGYTLFLLATGADGDEAKAPVPVEEKKKERSKLPMTIVLIAQIGILIAAPQAAAEGVNKLLHLNVPLQSPAFQAITGGFKLLIVVGMLLGFRLIFSDIRRVFQFHGAEHKTISTYEAGEDLTVANARAKTTLHPRCGTTFLVMVALVSIVVFTMIGGLLPKIDTGTRWLDSVVFFLFKIPFLPLIAAVTFEIQRIFARYCTTGPLRVLLWPGFLCQKITTIEPDDHQLEVALASLRVTLFRESGKDSDKVEKAPSPTPAEARYATFDALMKAPQLRRAA
jgi:uncharacterized protein YqhQ